MVLNFAIVGVQKAATTALARYLDQHPLICLPPSKETHFFRRSFSGGRAEPRDEAHLTRHFSHCSKRAFVGDATPIYSYWPYSLELLAKHSPRVRCILVLRDPVLRAFSAWNMEVARGRERLSFSTAIRQGRCRVAQSPLGVHKIYSYVERGFYHGQIERLYQQFPKDQIFVLRSDTVKHDSSVLAALTQFLELPDFNYQPINEHLAPGAIGRQPENIDDFFYLHDLYRADLQALEPLISFSIRDWIENPSWAPGRI